MSRTPTRAALSILTAFLLLAAPAAFAQTGPGAGQDVDEPVPPGLEAQTPTDQPLTEEDVQLYVPYQDQLIGRVSIPDEKLATLVQPEGRTWRAFRMDWLFWGAAIVILGMLAGLAIFYFWRGTIRLEHPRSGRWVPRFNGLERFTHWATALAFLSLAITGLIITFGRYVLIPVLGHGAFTAVAQAAKYVHNFSSVPFVIGIVLMFVLWIRDNIPTRADVAWVRNAGGMLRKQSSFHPETGRFNAGQKGVFWIVVLGGAIMAVTGYMLLTPFSWTGISGIQIAHVVHAVLAALMVAMILGHIYIGTLGMEGAFDAMGRGEVDETWAVEHHRGWYEAQRRRAGRIPAGARRAGAD